MIDAHNIRISLTTPQVRCLLRALRPLERERTREAHMAPVSGHEERQHVRDALAEIHLALRLLKVGGPF
jgi:hypothetical protein